MAHSLLNPGCTVYVWKPRGIMRGMMQRDSKNERVGHAAVKVTSASDFVYVSFWPKDEPAKLPIDSSASPTQTATKALAQGGLPANTTFFGKTLPQMLQASSTDGDADHEHGKADHRFRFTAGLDWDAMVTAGKKAKLECKSYNLWKRNCCNAVANVLHAGNPQVTVPLFGSFTNIWQPGDIISYCQKLATAIKLQNPNAAMEKVGPGGWA